MRILSKPIELCYDWACVVDDLAKVAYFKATTALITAYAQCLSEEEQEELEELLEDLF